MPDAAAPCDVFIYGASLGGVAAALSAADAGASVVLADPGEWVGGQLTAQGVCTPDENRWIEAGGGNRSYRRLREAFRDHYRVHCRLSDLGRAAEHLNVGECWVSRVAVEPLVALQVLLDELSSRPGIRLLQRTHVVASGVRADRIVSLTTTDHRGVAAARAPAVVIDATDLGDLIPLVGAEHVVGAEGRGETGEDRAPETPRPDWVQPFTFPFALELRPRGEDHTIAAPHDYAELRSLQRYHVLDGAMRGMFGELGWWSYRRVISARLFDDERYPCDVAMVNTASSDYLGGTVPDGSEQQEATLARARRVSLGYLYWLQTECPREDGSGVGYPELRLRADLFGTHDGVAPSPYIRESRRIRALSTVVEDDVVAGSRYEPDFAGDPRARPCADTCGIGHYWLDIHKGATDDPPHLMDTRPFQAPLGALVPVRLRNLLAGCKNLGVTHLTNGAFRLHPIEWCIGEAAGALAAFSIAKGREPRDVAAGGRLLSEFQEQLLARGVPLYWWGDLAAEHAAFAAAQRLALRGLWPPGREIEFRPEAPVTDDLRHELEGRIGRSLEWLRAMPNRAEAALALDAELRRG